MAPGGAGASTSFSSDATPRTAVLNSAQVQEQRTEGPEAPPPTAFHALVVGNSTYRYLAPELAPTHQCAQDAADLSALLTSKGYTVSLVQNGSKADMDSAVLRFLQGLPRHGCTALVYFSGHGTAHAGQNYLVPVDGAAPEDGNAGGRVHGASQTHSASCRVHCST
jgi:hypothetical protein